MDKLKEAIEKNDTDTLQQMIAGDHIDIDAYITPVCTYNDRQCNV